MRTNLGTLLTALYVQIDQHVLPAQATMPPLSVRDPPNFAARALPRVNLEASLGVH